MNKKIIGIVSITGAVVLGTGAFAAGAIMSNKNNIEESSVYEESVPQVELLTELKIGKYYLENGTNDEYIEVYNDNTLQVFGLDYFQRILNKPQNRYILSLDESEYAKIAADYQKDTDFWKSRNYYWLSDNSAVIRLSTEKPAPGQIYSKSAWILSYTDENTILFNKETIYKFSE